MHSPHALLCCALLCASNSLLAAQQLSVTSDERATPVLELFTSQGCSSCPPAEQWLSQLTQAPEVWSEIIPMAFHVDYWDDLGWADSFANAQFSARQRSYASHAAVGSVYTPGFVLAGQEWRGWFAREQLHLPTGPKVGKLAMAINGDHLQLTFSPAGKPPEQLTAYVVQLGFGLHSKIARGENAGKILAHDFVVLTLQQASASSINQWQIKLKPEARGERQAVVAWLGLPGNPAPYQSVATWLPAATSLAR